MSLFSDYCVHELVQAGWWASARGKTAGFKAGNAVDVVCAYLDGPPWDVEHVLCLHKHVIPKACFLVALHLGQVKVWTCHKPQQNLCMNGKSACHNSSY